ncbi:septum formation family protein [Rathayibacter rathayi]|uniref:septum formation family protein n=1 Tax=Rathayibacter rathayi TaxID=33887 RepID=UPI000CE86406|nr:septum formation family protein [Rathayibacter rathayi]PPF22735.1 hypothetical protein C5C34_11345 [Rathayibacter rathayi]PPG11983.1 hypothetical protein C5C11_10725 [Rathayibacter rathayi]PPG70235.1 hypothetical protein C5C02_04840 [Rathayibacter rathayi]PPG78085.1 hypothetical protein C5C23_03365 [Rathayibacter rathayi]PPG87203.1 hypothetical protein C5C47_11275 [Rathayibacter rathayi]
MRSRRAALAGAALLLLLSGCSSVVGPDGPEAVRDEGGTVTTAGVTDVFSLRRGDCLADPGDNRIADVDVVPCSEEHALEVFHAFAQPGERYTSRTTLLAQAEASCEPEFGAVMGIAYGDSALEYRSMVPSEVGWRHGDRTIVCAVFDPADASTTGSLVGSVR